MRFDSRSPRGRRQAGRSRSRWHLRASLRSARAEAAKQHPVEPPMGRSRLRASSPHWAPSQDRRTDRRLDRWLGSHSATRLIPPSPCRQTRRQPQHPAMPQRARQQPRPQRPLSAGVETKSPPQKSRDQCTLPTPLEMNPACVFSPFAATNIQRSGTPSPTVSTHGSVLSLHFAVGQAV